MDGPKYVKTDTPGFVRDTYSQAVVSDNSTELQRYRARVKQFESTRVKLATIDTITAELDELRGQMADLIHLVKSSHAEKEDHAN